jgi:hypothetical protein
VFRFSWGVVVPVFRACRRFRFLLLGGHGCLSECRCRPGRFGVCRQARAAASAAAVICSSDDVAVTWVEVMDRMAWCRAAVKDSSSAVTMAPFPG